MSEKQKLVIISGSPCVGKTTVADNLVSSYENSAHLDDDWVWRVNPFSFDDPRNDGIYPNMAFVISTYLNLNFEYVFLSSVRMIGKGRESLLHHISATDYATIGFTLTCSEKTLIQRHKSRGDDGEVSFQWLRTAPYPNDHVIHTDHKTIAQIAGEIRAILDKK